MLKISVSLTLHQNFMKEKNSCLNNNECFIRKKNFFKFILYYIIFFKIKASIVIQATIFLHHKVLIKV